MDIPVSTFRREMFSVLEKAKAGEDVVLTHKGSRYRLTPEVLPSKLGRVTPFENYWNPEVTEQDVERMKAKVQEKLGQTPVYLDTHVCGFLVSGQQGKLSDKAKHALQ